MAERPTVCWRRFLAEQQAAVAAGTLDSESDDAWAMSLFPAAFTADVDAVLTLFEQNVDQADLTTQHDIWVLVRSVILELNAVSDEWGLIETGEREELCRYIDDALTAAGANLSAVASSSGIDRDEITDEWREWATTVQAVRGSVVKRAANSSWSENNSVMDAGPRVVLARSWCAS